ncbi:MAG: glycoside hydrolase family 5 protein [Thermoplasmata archaeon]|nr:glycoside hydrolase family 5 protein [Thermoplasmata archaeon]
MGASARSLRSIRTPTADRPPVRPQGRRWWIAVSFVPAVVVAIVALLTFPGTIAGGGIGSGQTPTLPIQGTPAAGPTLSLANATVASSPSPTFWGADVRPYYALGTDESTAFSQSGLQFTRWPGGSVVDRYNVTSNALYFDDGAFYAPPTDVAAFAQWCVAVGCHAIVGLPAEIDSPATAAYYVSYIERTVGFTPDYWEIGNEPAVWTHFGTPWAHWNTSQNTNATPVSYAQLLHAYISAIRGVDPNARIVGLGGLGTGAYGETTWITAAVRANGANLSAVSIHVYPAGGSTLTNASASDFYATLTDPSSLLQRVPLDRAAIAAVCRGCHVALFASELGSGTEGGVFTPYMAGFAVVPYLAAEFAQALTLNMTQVDLFSFEGSYDGSILNATGDTTEVATLYQSFLATLRSQVLATNLTVPSRGFYVLATRSPAGGATAVLLVNTNVSATFSLQLRVSGATPSPGYFSVWNATTGRPATSSWASSAPTSFSLGPEGVGLIELDGGIVWGRALPRHPGPSLGLALALPPSTFEGILGLAAPTSMTFPCWAVGTARRKGQVLPWRRPSLARPPSATPNRRV